MKKNCGTEQDHIEIKVPCRAEYVRTVRATAADFARSCGLGKQEVEEIEVALSEAVSNVVRHAYKGCKQSYPVTVRIEHRGDRLLFEVIDRGCGFPAPEENVTPEPDLTKEGGLGIILIKSLMDSVSYDSKPNVGTTITMTKRISGRGSSGGLGNSRLAASGQAATAS